MSEGLIYAVLGIAFLIASFISVSNVESPPPRRFGTFKGYDLNGEQVWESVSFPPQFPVGLNDWSTLEKLTAKVEYVERVK